MPVLLRSGSLTFFFWSNEGGEPPHVHVQQASDRRTAKLWLNPVRLDHVGSLRPSDVARARKIVIEHEADFLAAWQAFFGNR